MAVHKYEVIGPLDVGGKATGETVELDEEEINVAALVEANAIKPLSAAAKDAVKDADKS